MVMVNFFIHALEYAWILYLKSLWLVVIVNLLYLVFRLSNYKKLVGYNLFAYYLLNVIVISLWKLPDSTHCLNTSIYYSPVYFDMHWMPFNVVRDVYNTYIQTNSILEASKFIWFTLLNVVYFIPFGMYLKYAFKSKWWHILILGMLFSFFIEYMQTSGIFGLYTCSWRHFDIDDVITNTIGALIGGWLLSKVWRKKWKRK